MTAEARAYFPARYYRAEVVIHRWEMELSEPCSATMAKIHAHESNRRLEASLASRRNVIDKGFRR